MLSRRLAKMLPPLGFFRVDIITSVILLLLAVGAVLCLYPPIASQMEEAVGKSYWGWFFSNDVGGLLLAAQGTILALGVIESWRNRWFPSRLALAGTAAAVVVATPLGLISLLPGLWMLSRLYLLRFVSPKDRCYLASIRRVNGSTVHSQNHER